MTRRDKLKQWIKDHREALVATGVVSFVVVGIVAIVKADNEMRRQNLIKDNALIDGINEALEKERGEGASFYPLEWTDAKITAQMEANGWPNHNDGVDEAVAK